MKKTLILFMLTALTCMLLADLQTPIMRKAAIDEHGNKTTLNQSSLRDVPEGEFVTEPQSLLTDYYDYMPGCYNSNPVRLQPDAMGGIYIAFHARETAASTRREYFAYIDASGNVTNIATIGTEDIHEEYAGIDIDPVTGDPFVSWHVNADPGTAQLECVLSYDLYHLGSPGLWKSPFIVIDDNIPSPLAPDDEFEWPYVFIGPSPDPDKRRVYIVASNGTNSPVNGNPCENVMIAYANFDVTDLNAQSELDWTYRTIDILDEWYNGNPEWIRPAHACAVSEDGKIAFMGYTVTEDATSPMTDRLYVLLNENYGEGDFVYYDADYYNEVVNPLNLDGTPRFPDENGDPHEIYFSPYLAHHMNTIFTDGGTMTYASIKIFFGTSSVDPTVTPSIISLSQNYPNPFNPSTTISFNLKEAGQVTLEVYNIKGQKVRTLVNEHKDVGRYNIEWNGKNDNNQSVSSGMYFYKMKSGVYTDTKKMILMK